MTRALSAQVVLSGTVGPLPMTSGESPGTSLISNVTTFAGAHIAASLPPLTADRCLRTQFISPIAAPLFSSARFTACLSASVSPAAGAASSAEPPPEIRNSTRSSAVRPCAICTMRSVARRPASSGTGCEASTTSIRPPAARYAGGTWS